MRPASTLTSPDTTPASDETGQRPAAARHPKTSHEEPKQKKPIPTEWEAKKTGDTMSNAVVNFYQANLTDLARAHSTFAAADELGGDAATEAPATSPLCIGIIVGATLGAGC